MPLAWYWINRTRPGLHLRAVGESPTAADALGVDVYRLRYAYVIVGGLLRRPRRGDDHARRLARLVRRPHGERRGLDRRRARDLRPWSPLRAAVGAYLFGAIRRMIIDLQGPETLFGFPNPFFEDHTLTFFLEMLPYVLVIVVLVAVSRRGDAQADRARRPRWASRTCGASAGRRPAVGASGARPPGRRPARGARGQAPSSASGPMSSIWTNPLVSKASCSGSRAAPSPSGANSRTTRSSPSTRA